MLTPKIQHYLSEHQTKYHLMSHMPAYTASQTAELAHVSGKKMAKSVVLKADGKFIMMLVPANQTLNLKEFSKWLGVKKLELASESEFETLFPECEMGAMPPFGHLYHMDVFVEDTLAAQENITFNAGTHTDLIEMAFEDFESLEQPKRIHWH